MRADEADPDVEAGGEAAAAAVHPEVRKTLLSAFAHGSEGHELSIAREVGNNFVRTLGTVFPTIMGTTYAREMARFSAAALSPTLRRDAAFAFYGLDAAMVLGNAADRYANQELSVKNVTADAVLIASSVVAGVMTGPSTHGMNAVAAHTYRFVRAPIELIARREHNAAEPQNHWRETAFMATTLLTHWAIQFLVYSAQASHVSRSGSGAHAGGAGFGESQGKIAAYSAFNAMGEVIVETSLPYIAAAIFGTVAGAGARAATVHKPIWTWEGAGQSLEAMRQTRLTVEIGPGVGARDFVRKLARSLMSGATAGAIATQNSSDQSSGINRGLTPEHAFDRTFSDGRANIVASLYYSLDTMIGRLRNAKMISAVSPPAGHDGSEPLADGQELIDMAHRLPRFPFERSVSPTEAPARFVGPEADLEASLAAALASHPEFSFLRDRA